MVSEVKKLKTGEDIAGEMISLGFGQKNSGF